MLVVSIALVAVLLSGGNETNSAPGAITVETATVQPEATTPPPTPTPVPAEVPPIPVELQSRLDALPEKLHTEATAAYESGRFSLEQLEQVIDDFENRNPNLRVGTVVSTEDNVLRFEVFTTGEVAEVTTFDGTLVVREGQLLQLQDLSPNELVMVVTSDGGVNALSIEAFGVMAP